MLYVLIQLFEPSKDGFVFEQKYRKKLQTYFRKEIYNMYAAPGHTLPPHLTPQNSPK